MFYYHLKTDSFTSLLTLYEFGSETPQFSEFIFGKNPLIEHLSAEQHPFGKSTLLLEKETSAWCFLDEGEMKVYSAVHNMELSVARDMFSANGKHDITGFLIQLYWLGLIKLAKRSFVVPETFAKGAVTQPGPLFILHLTDSCNLSCSYCFADSKPSSKRKMTWETAKKAIDLILAFPSEHGTIEFSGGEPLLEFDLLRKIINYTNEKSAAPGKHYRFNLQTNGTLVTKELAEYAKTCHLDLSLSLDGDAIINNYTRRFSSGKGTYNAILNAMEILGNGVQNFGVICVISRKNAHKIRYLLEHFRSLGLVRVKLNPICKLGRAIITWDDLSLEAEEFLKVHTEYINYIIEDPQPIIDDNTYFMLKNMGQKMHSYRCMRSQCGAGITFFSIDPLGNVFPCDRFRDKQSLKSGNVETLESLGDVVLKNASVKKLAGRFTEEIEICSECSYKRFCEAGCTYETFYNSGKIKAPHPWCPYYKGIYHALFKAVSMDNTLVHKLKVGAEVFQKSWFDNLE